MEESLEALKDAFAARLDTSGLDLRNYSPLTLAYIGDSIYDLLIRTMVVAQGNTNNQALHRRTTVYVRAKGQAKMAAHLLPLLTEEEERVYRRGRNAKMGTRTRNASLGEYKMATGLEALLGYLYLQGNYDRMLALVAAGIAVLENTEK